MGLARRFGLLAVVIAALVAIPANAVGQQTKVVGGDNADEAEFPYQVLLIIDLPGIGPVGCGGTIKDSTHIVTAAHCVEGENPSGYPLIASPSGITMLHGGVDLGSGTPGDSDDLEVYGGSVTTVSVDRRRMRRFAEIGVVDIVNEYDTALLTLSSPLAFDSETSSIPLATTTDLGLPFGFGAAQNNKPFISGWGDTAENGSGPELLQYAQVGLVPDTGPGFSCNDHYEPLRFVQSAMLCAGEPAGGVDTCQGDSGGPLALDSIDGSNGDLGNGPGPGAKLLGITSFGDGCARAGVPGVYSDVTEPGTTTFLSTPGSPPPGLPGDRPRASGTARVGSTISCIPPGGTSVNEYIWYAGNATSGFTSFAVTPSPSVVLPAATIGRQVGCDVRIEGPGGYRYVEFVSVIGPVAGAPGPPPAAPEDTTRPRARVQRVRCNRRRRCTITIRATDTGGTVKRVSARVKGRYRRCRRVSGVRRCRTRRVNKVLRVRRRKTGTYIARIRLRKGRYTAYARARDTANLLSKLARKRFRVR